MKRITFAAGAVSMLFATFTGLCVAAPGGAGGREGRQLRQIDADGNGMISRAEAGASPVLSANFDAIDANKDGQITPDELRAWNKGRGVRHTSDASRRAQNGLQESFARADSNGDGQISRAEAASGMPRLAPHFDAADTDHDGLVSYGELRRYAQTKREARVRKPDR
jgi:hypothetical protein